MMRSAYDYIIVGGGAAGCVVAREILHRKLGTVLLVESGKRPSSSKLRVPSDYVQAFGTRWDWNHETVAQAGLAGRRLRLPAGKALGGSTAINAMIYIEPHACDFEVWQSAAGSEWSSTEVRAGYQRVCDWLHASSVRLASGSGIPSLPSLPQLDPSLCSILEGAVERGWTASSFPDGFDQPRLGIDVYRRMQRDGRRISVWRLLELEQNITSSNTVQDLSVLCDAQAVRISMDGDCATGVEVACCGQKPERVFASKGVVVSAGAIESPRLLMSSGLGPREDLSRAGVSVRRDMPRLGWNLHDHLVYPIIFRIRNEDSRSLHTHREDRVEYIRHRTGRRSSNLAELGGFFHADASGFQGTSRTTAPAFQWHITPTHYFESPPFASRHPCISFAITPLRPLSRGRLLPIADRGSWNPAGALPIAIDPAYLQVPSDVQDFLEAIAWTRNMIAESGWDALLAEEVFPRPRRTDWTLAESSLRRFASTIYHYAGTCGLGIDSDSCLDPHFRVRGIDRLWVCDASVMPQLVSCNPQVTVMMMAMRLADWLGQ